MFAFLHEEEVDPFEVKGDIARHHLWTFLRKLAA